MSRLAIWRFLAIFALKITSTVTMDIFEQRIKELREQINRLNHEYYVLNAPTVSDRQFDALLRELQDLEQTYPQYDDPLSPTHRVGSDLSEGFKQVEHERRMMSLSNSYSIDEVRDFLRRAHDGLGGAPMTIVGEMKYDGTSISITYENGRLVRAVTRGDGVRGDDVTANVITIKSVPLQLAPGNWPNRFEVRGEILLPWSSFEKLNAERAFNEEPLFANPRNAAAGTLKLLNSAEVSRRGLDAYFYFLLSDDLPHSTHYDNMRDVASWGFKTAHMELLSDIDSVEDFVKHWDKERKNLPVATDGLVFKLNDTRQWETLGATAKSPRWAIAYKFAPERELTRLRSISFEVGRTGVITPVANLDPVLLSGTTVKRASMHNEDFIRTMDIHDGDMVYVEKGGEIIPKIVGVDKSRRQVGSKPVDFVTHCPVCGTPLRRVEGEAAWVCPNADGCKPQVVGRVEHFVGRKAMNIDGVGHEVAIALHDHCGVISPADLYDLTAEKLQAMPSFKEKSIQNLLNGIAASRVVPFERVLFAISIPQVGENTAKLLARNLHDIDKLMATPAEQLSAIPEIGPKIAQEIITFFASEQNRDQVERLRAAGLQMALSQEQMAARGTELEGKKIVISGVFTHHSRDEYKELIELHGGKNVGSISKATSFILAGDNMGPSKLEKAQKLNIPILNEDAFLALLNPQT